MTDRDDVRRDLRQLRERREAMDHYLETYYESERETVLRAREVELSWSEIATELGRSASSVHRQYREDG
jgi:DNA-directed RNA polymerase specialized sigma24 family protein